MLKSVVGLSYDPEYIARFFDDYGEREWARFDTAAMDRVNLEVHRRLLGEFVRPGDRVLDAGAGPGRFTLELARLGATVVAGDISPRQLELHADKTAEVEESIEAREVLDILDLSRFEDASFDAVVCYGGPLSYVLDGASTALGELLRVTKPGGHVLLSVMSMLGAARAFFDQLPGMVEEFGWDRAVRDIFATGDLPADINRGHVCRLYRWSDLERLFDPHPCRVVAASAANFLSVRQDDWDERFLELEVEACREPGALDGGTHIIAVLERSAASP
jgi:SAM-dependent methyltransferase